MKKIISSFLALFLIITFISCGSDSENKEKKENIGENIEELGTEKLPVSSLDENEKNSEYNFYYKFKQGESFKYRLTTISESIRDIVSDTSFTSNFNQNISKTIELKTLTVFGDSVAELSCQLTSASIEADINGEKISYKSGTVKDSSELKKFYEFESLLNNPFNIKINKNGKVLDIYKVENILNKMIEYNGMQVALKPEEKVTLQNQMVEGMLSPLVHQIIKELPDKKMGINSEWEKDLDPVQYMVFSIAHKNHYKVSALNKLGDDKIATIDGSSTTQVKGDTVATRNGVNYSFTKPTSDESGKIFFNIDRGLIQKSITKTKMNISYKMEMPTQTGLKTGSATEKIINNNTAELF